MSVVYRFNSNAGMYVFISYISFSSRKLSRVEFNFDNVKPFRSCVTKNLDFIFIPVDLRGTRKCIFDHGWLCCALMLAKTWSRFSKSYVFTSCNKIFSVSANLATALTTFWTHIAGVSSVICHLRKQFCEKLLTMINDIDLFILSQYIGIPIKWTVAN